MGRARNHKYRLKMIYKELTTKQKKLFNKIENLFTDSLNNKDIVTTLGLLIQKYKLKGRK